MTLKENMLAEAMSGSISPQVQARILAEALPHLIRYDQQTVVIKFGGHAMGDQALADAFAQDIVYLKQSGVNPIVVHGGGPQIGAMLKKLGDSQRTSSRACASPTSRPSMFVEMVLAGAIEQGNRHGDQPPRRQGRRHLRARTPTC